MTRIIYTAGRYRSATRWGVEQNVRAAEAVAYEVAKLGGFPLCPHTNTRGHFEDLQDAEFWLGGTLELLRRSDAVIMVPGWLESSGARAERDEALRLGLPVFYTLDELRVWLARVEGETAAVARVEGGA